MDARIQQLVDRLPQLDEREKELRRESNTCAFPVLGDDGQARMEIADAPRLAEIRHELEDIAEEREAVQDKINRLAELLGDGLLIPSTSSDYDYIARLKVELANHFFHKCLTENRTWLLPEEAITDPRYLEKKAKIMPEIESAQARITEAERQQEAAYAILSE